jgi:hypothetical protein
MQVWHKNVLLNRLLGVRFLSFSRCSNNNATVLTLIFIILKFYKFIIAAFVMKYKKKLIKWLGYNLLFLTTKYDMKV